MEVCAVTRWITGPQAQARAAGVSEEEYAHRRACGELWCWGCRTWQPDASYHRAPSGREGRRSKCKRCISAMNKRYWANSCEAVKDKYRQARLRRLADSSEQGPTEGK